MHEVDSRISEEENGPYQIGFAFLVESILMDQNVPNEVIRDQHGVIVHSMLTSKRILM